MGIEYRISCPSENLQKLEEFLLRAGGRASARFPTQVEFRFRQTSPDEMPDATAIVEPQGLYFCDHCGAREAVSVLFRRIIDEALTLSGSSDSVVVKTL